MAIFILGMLLYRQTGATGYYTAFLYCLWYAQTTTRIVAHIQVGGKGRLGILTTQLNRGLDEEE
jgi:hypothetical protein